VPLLDLGLGFVKIAESDHDLISVIPNTCLFEKGADIARPEMTKSLPRGDD
jgi:hypothetical protein